jgi:hypothetical protein
MLNLCAKHSVLTILTQATDSILSLRKLIAKTRDGLAATNGCGNAQVLCDMCSPIESKCVHQLTFD